MELFDFKFKKLDESVYTFDVKFGTQNGWMTIREVDGKITDVTLDCKFSRPLGAYNDKGRDLYKVSEYVLGEYRKK